MLTEKEKKELLNYRQQLEMPPFRYILIHGLTWAILLIILMSLIEYIFLKRSLQVQWEEGLLLRIVIMPFAGLLYGWINRQIILNRYRKLKAKESINQ